MQQRGCRFHRVSRLLAIVIALKADCIADRATYLQRGLRCHAGIVHEDVQATEGVNRGIDSILGPRFVRDVERNSPYTLSELASDVDELLRITGRGHDAVPGLESLFCERTAKAAGSSGN
jgi:hypothetical protein